MAMVSMPIEMEMFIKDIGNMIKLMEKVPFGIQMEKFDLENLKINLLMGLAIIYTVMDHIMKGNGIKTNKKVKGKKFGNLVSHMKGNIKITKKMASAFLIWPMGMFMKGTSRKISSMAKVCLSK